MAKSGMTSLSGVPERKLGPVDAEMTRGRDSIVLLADGLSVLDLFTAARRSLTFSEIQQSREWDKNLCKEVIGVLLSGGLISYDADTSSYTVGVRALELAYAYEHSSPLVDICTPIMRDIRDKVNETVMLAIRSGDYRVNIAQMISLHPVHQDVPEGQRRPLYIGCGGKILLAAMSDEEIAEYLGRTPLKQMSPTTITDRDRLMHDVRVIREVGFSETFSDGNEGGAAIAVAIRNAGRRTIASLVVSIPLYRYRQHLREQVIQLLMRGSDEITEQLGGNAIFG